jgi:hypothetical protein
MTVYEVVEYITEDFKKDWANSENASGMYSSIEKARQAALARIAEVYTEEEIAKMNIPNDWEYLEVPANEWTESCTYIIYSYELDERMG